MIESNFKDASVKLNGSAIQIITEYALITDAILTDIGLKGDGVVLSAENILGAALGQWIVEHEIDANDFILKLAERVNSYMMSTLKSSKIDELNRTLEKLMEILGIDPKADK